MMTERAAIMSRKSNAMCHSVQVSGVIMAGGVSRRLGRNKALEHIGGRTLIERVIDSLAPLTTEVLVVVARPEQARALLLPPSIRVVSDRYPGRGSLGGIFTGVDASTQPWSLVVACDMPFLNRDLLRHLIDQSTNVDAVVPRLGGQPEPLHALYSKACLGPMERMLQAGDLKIAPLFEAVRVRYVNEGTIDRIDPRHLSFFNINTKADLEEAQRLLREAGFCSATLDLGARGADDLFSRTSHSSEQLQA
jgi:molybdopterin-guanine dinucleotide biosynthesis protein A